MNALSHEHNGFKIYWHDNETHDILIWDYPEKYKTDDVMIIGAKSDEMIRSSSADRVNVIMNLNESDAERTRNMIGFFGSAFKNAEDNVPNLGQIVFVAPTRFTQMFIEMIKKFNASAAKMTLFANSIDEAVALLREARTSQDTIDESDDA